MRTATTIALVLVVLDPACSRSDLDRPELSRDTPADASDVDTVDAKADATSDATTDAEAGVFTVVAKQVTAGHSHTCAVASDGTPFCWGANNTGQLGVAMTTFASAVPVTVTGLASAVESVSAGFDFTCAVTVGGGAVCWGDNAVGQLGDGSTTNRSSPVGVAGLSSGVVGITAGADHACALTSDGTAWCWGRNTNGQLGNGSTVPSLVPVAVSSLPSVSGIAAGFDHTCAVTSSHDAFCWGYNLNGEVGDGSTADRHVPVSVAGLSNGATALSAGGNSCALALAGDARCWGYNGDGQLGNGSTTNSSIPVSVSGLSNGVTALFVGFRHACALTSAGAAQCWGYGWPGELGDGLSHESSIPVAVSGLSSGVITMATGDYHTCAVTQTGAVFCWGLNDAGQLGTGSLGGNSLIPVAVVGFP